jgi:hypothetical protein
MKAVRIMLGLEVNRIVFIIGGNGLQIGEVRDFQHKSRLELLNLKFRKKCQ